MPIALAIAGVLLIVVAVQGTEKEFAQLFSSEFSGKNNFLYWATSIVVIGALGYIPGMKRLSDYFLVLVLLVIFLVNGGFFDKLNQALNTASFVGPDASMSDLKGALNAPPIPHIGQVGVL